jgi:hypothetical protein
MAEKKEENFMNADSKNRHLKVAPTKAIFGLMCGLCLLISTLPCHAESASTIARQALQAAPPKDWNFSALIKTTADSEGKLQSGERLLTVQYRKLGDGGKKVVYQTEDGQGIQIVLPSGSSAVQMKDVAGASINDYTVPFLGSAFTMEDVALRFLSWKNQESAGEETLKDRKCWKIVSYPSNDDKTAYSKVESWIDQQYRALLKAVAYDAEGRVVKEFNVRSFKQFDDIWMLKTLDLQAPVLGGRSRLEILEAQEKK